MNMKQKKGISITRFGRDELAKKKKPIGIFGYFLIGLPIVVFIVFAALFIEQSILRSAYVCQFAEQQSTWVASLPSYWGGIIGGLVGGSISFLGIAITIKYYRNADIENRRLNIQPFLVIQSETTKSFTGSKKPLFSFENASEVFVKCMITNIGRGFALIITYNDGSIAGGYSYRHTLQKDCAIKDFVFCVPNKDCEHTFYIQFMDEYMNEYIQSFNIIVKKNNNDLPKVTINPDFPQVIENAMK